MAFTKPAYPRNAVDTAGKTLINLVATPAEIEQALAVIDNWRSSHSLPLQSVYVTLRNRAQKVSPNPLVAQRLKRLSSIDAKLRRFRKKMKLSQMNDIGGCRAVMLTVGQVDELVRRYEESKAKAPHSGHKFVRPYDYIQRPKSDGYRSVHLIYKYRSTAEEKQDYNGLRIEIQLRSRLQHFWATAVETVDAFTGQALKSSIGEESWKRFFALMGSVIALKEKRSVVPGTPSNGAELKKELTELYRRENMGTTFEGMSTAVEHIAEKVRNAKFFLLALDTKERRLRVKGYKANEQSRASAEALQVEKQYRAKPEVQVVLVSVATVKALRRAYRNYYLDMDDFLNQVNEAIS